MAGSARATGDRRALVVGLYRERDRFAQVLTGPIEEFRPEESGVGRRYLKPTPPRLIRLQV